MNTPILNKYDTKRYKTLEIEKRVSDIYSLVYEDIIKQEIKNKTLNTIKEKKEQQKTNILISGQQNKVENTNTYINIKEKQKQKEVETQKRQDMLNEVQKRLERLTKLADVFTKGSELYNMSMNLLKQNYRHAISLRSRQMRMKAYKELQDSLIFAETSFEALIVSAREARNEAIFIKNIVEDEKLPIPIDKLNLDNLIQSLDNVLSFRIEDDEEYMDIKCFCEEKLHSDIN